MSLSNPVQYQKFNYKRLNEHRIRGLLNQRISDKREQFFINQFVTVQNDLEQGEGSSKLVIPGNSQLYKIVGIHKNGFQLTLLNVGTGAKQEVLHSKGKALDLDALENMCFATPNLFNKLVQLRRKLRNTYEAGSKTSSHLYQIPFCEPLSNSPVVPGVDQNEGPENGESDEVHEEDTLTRMTTNTIALGPPSP